MTTTPIAFAAATRSTRTTSFVKRLADGYRAMRRRRHQRHAMSDLRRLSGHALKDIGLHRSEISSIVYVSEAGRRRRYAGN